MHYFVTGTDTHVGKTYATCLLLNALRRNGVEAVGYKPVACGDREDAEAILTACGDELLSITDVNPVFLKHAVSPFVAALLENRSIDQDELRSLFFDLSQRYPTVLVEGAGGWEVPLSPGFTMADFAESLGLPVIVVVDNKLGALNHTLLTVRNIQSRSLTCAGIILNHVRDERDTASISNRQVIEQFLSVPVIAEIMHGETEIDWPL